MTDSTGMRAGGDRFLGCLLGLAVGDAVGTTVEFRPPGSFEPVTDMVGGGPFALRAGQWTDDTSMALCIAASLVETGRFDAGDQMDRYLRWRDEGYMSSTGHCFDIGGTISAALRRYEQSGDPFAGSSHPQSAGNGCIMRLAPVPMFYAADPSEAVRYAAESSRTTHGAAECLESSSLFASMICSALDGADKESILRAGEGLEFSERKVRAIAEGDYRDKQAGWIRGSGYVIDCLEAALWCFETTTNFSDAVLKATNLGDDADTTAAVCGQIAGAHYGVAGIPSRWLGKLVGREEIERLAIALATN